MMMPWPLILAVGFFVVTMGLAVGPLLACRLFVRRPWGERASAESPDSVESFPLLRAVFGMLLATAIALVAVRFGRLPTAPIVPGDSRTVSSEFARMQVIPPHAPPGESLTTSPTTELVRLPNPVEWGDVDSPIAAIPLLVVVLTGAAISLALGRRSSGHQKGQPPYPVVAAGLISVLVLGVAVMSIYHTRNASLRLEVAHRQEIDRLAAEQARWMTDVRVRQAADVTRHLSAAAAILSPPPAPRPPAPAQAVSSVSIASDAAESSPVAETIIVEPSVGDTAPDGGAAEPAVMEYISTNSVGVPRETLPDWTTDGGNGTSAIRVIDSGLHATVELAEAHTLTELTSLLTAEFVERYPDARGWQPSEADVLNSGSLLQRAIERSEITVGEFTSPMYRAYWQVDSNAAAVLYDAWRPMIVRSRLGWIGGGFGLLTLLFGSTAAVLRVNQQTGGRHLKSLTAGTLAIWGAIGAALLFVA